MNKSVTSVIFVLVIITIYYSLKDEHTHTIDSQPGIAPGEIFYRDQNTAPTRHTKATDKADVNAPIEDYYAYALSLLDGAKLGDSQSQYYLAKTISKCGFLMESRSILEDKLLLYISLLPDDDDKNYLLTIQEDIIKCSYFELSDLSIFSEGQVSTWRELVFYWNKNAALSGHMVAASELLSSGLVVDNESLRQQLIDQLVESLSEGNPEVSFYYGASLQSEQEHREEGIAWMLYACQSGFDCGYNSQSNDRFLPLLHCIVTDTGDENSQNCFRHLTISNYIKYSAPEDLYQRASAISTNIARAHQNSTVDSKRIQRNLQSLLSQQ